MNALLVSWNGGGAVPPMLGLGAELRRRGHMVRWLGPSIMRGAVEQAGMEFRALVHDAGQDNLARLSPREQQAMMAETAFGEGYPLDLRLEVARARPDVCIIDVILQSALAAAESLGLPRAILVHTVASLSLQARERGIQQLNQVRFREGLSPVASAQELWARTEAVLVASTPLLDDAAPQGIPTLRYVGPIFESDDPAGIATPPEIPTTPYPLVLVGMSTTYIEGQEGLLGRVIEALDGLDVQGLASVGDGVERASLPSVANLAIHQWLPHNRVLPRASLMITHAGHSSVMRALSFGVPLLCIPLGRDQPFNSERVQAIGAGVALTTSAEPSVIAEAVRTILCERSYAEVAQSLADAIAAAGPGAVNAADAVEEVTRA